MKTLRAFFLVSFAAWASASAQDPALDEIGKVRTELLFGTNGSVAPLGSGVTQLSKAERVRLKKVPKLGTFKNFVKLGSVEQAVLKGYKSWAQPIKNSEAIMVTFQPQATIKEEKKLRLDVEYWQKSKMALRWDRVFEVGKRVYLIGPKWRDGNLIITVELLSLKSK